MNNDMTHTMLIGVAVLATAIGVCSTLITGKTPLYWMALMLLYFEAGFWQVLVSLAIACKHFASNYAGTVQNVRSSLSQTSKQELAIVARKDVR